MLRLSGQPGLCLRIKMRPANTGQECSYSYLRQPHLHSLEAGVAGLEPACCPPEARAWLGRRWAAGQLGVRWPEAAAQKSCL